MHGTMNVKFIQTAALSVSKFFVLVCHAVSGTFADVLKWVILL
jgi:hypothetical protein